MGKGTRIRWQNVAKLGAGAVACAGLLAALPGLLKRPEPPRLPADVGLAHVAAGAPAVPPPAGNHEERDPVAKRQPNGHAREAAHPERRPEHEHERHTPPAGRHPADPEPAPVAAPTPAPPAPPPTPTAAPAPACSPPPPAPAPAPVAASPSPPPSASSGGGGSEFGFEH